MPIVSNAARTRLQVLFAQFARRSFDAGGLAGRGQNDARADRLAWATEILHKPVTSFSDLSSADAKTLIDLLQAQLGIQETLPSRRQRGTPGARKLGTEGRSGHASNETTLLAPGDAIFTKIQQQMSRLDMTEARLQAFLRSASGPNNGRDTIRTLGEANKVYWALKRMADRQATRNAHPAARRESA